MVTGLLRLKSTLVDEESSTFKDYLGRSRNQSIQEFGVLCTQTFSSGEILALGLFSLFPRPTVVTMVSSWDSREFISLKTEPPLCVVISFTGVILFKRAF